MMKKLSRLFETNTKYRFLKNAFFIMGTTGISKLLSFGVVMFAARRLTVADFGILAFAISLTNSLQSFVRFGTEGVGIRDVAKDRSLFGQYLATIATVRFLMALFIFCGVLAFCFFSGVTGVKFFTVSIGASVFFLIALEPHWVFFAHEKTEWIFFTSVTMSLLYLFFAFCFLKWWPLPTSVVLANFMAVAVSSALGIFLIVRFFGGFRFGVEGNKVKTILSAGIMMALIGFFTHLLMELNTLMINYLSNDTTIGYYNAVSRLINALIYMQFALITALFPILSQRVVRMDGSFRRALKRSFQLGLAYSALAILVLNIFPESILKFFYGDKYLTSVLILKTAAWLLPLFLLGGIFCYALLAGQREFSALKVISSAVGLNFFVNFYTIPKMGALGAVVSSLIASAYFLCFTGLYVRKMLMQAGR